jgi:cobalt ECF transporter T component CbiQ
MVANTPPGKIHVSRSHVVGSTLRTLTRALSRALISEHTARQRGLMQALDPRVRVVGVFALVIAVAVAHKIAAVLLLLAAAVLAALASAVSIRTLAVRVWLPVLAFTGVIAVPALFLTPGAAISPSSPITQQGLHTALLLIARVETAVTLTTVLVLTTPWTQILRALRSLYVTKEVVMMLGMAHRYLFLLAETATQMFESRESRRVGLLRGPPRRRLVAETSGVLMSKSLDLSQDIFLAMQSRGYRGEVYVLSDPSMRASDYIALLVFLGVAVLAIWWGR